MAKSPKPRFSCEESEKIRKKKIRNEIRTLDDFSKACLEAKKNGKYLTYKEWASEEYKPKVVIKK